MIYYQIKMQKGYALSVDPNHLVGGQLVLANPNAADDKQLWGVPFVPNCPPNNAISTRGGFAMVNKSTGQLAKAQSDSQGAAVIGAALPPINRLCGPLATWTLSSEQVPAVRPFADVKLNLNAYGGGRPGAVMVVWPWGGGQPNELWSFEAVGDAPPPLDGPHPPQQYFIARQLLSQAETDKTFKASLVTDPAHIFADAGYPLEIEDYRAFQNFFVQSYLGPKTASAVDNCTRCQVGLWGIAAAIVAIGAAALTFLTPASAFVIGFAATFQCTVPIGLAFLQGLAALAVFTISSVLINLCNWIGLCPTTVCQ